MPTTLHAPRRLLRALPLLLAAACASGGSSGGGGGNVTYTPLECGHGSGETHRAEISDTGGIVAVRGHSLRVPRGGVSVRESFHITEVPGSYVRVEVGPHGRRFGRNATLTLSYARCGGNPAGYTDLHISEVRSTQNGVEILRTLDSRVDADARTVTTTTGLEHLSGYLISGT